MGSLYFAQAYRLLKPGGLFLKSWHCVPARHSTGSTEVNLLAEQSGFEVRDVENLREHYARRNLYHRCRTLLVPRDSGHVQRFALVARWASPLQGSE